MLDPFPGHCAEDRKLDTALGGAVRACREAVGMTREQTVADLPFNADCLRSHEMGGTRLTFGRLVTIADVLDADPLDLLCEAVLAVPDHHPAPGTTTRLVHTIHQMHPERREHLAEMIAVLGVKARS